MSLQLKYGFHSSDNNYSFVSSSFDIADIANRIALKEKATEWVTGQIFNDGRDFFNIHYKKDDCAWALSMKIYVEYLFEIDSTFYAIPKWTFNGDAEIIK